MCDEQMESINAYWGNPHIIWKEKEMTNIY